MGVYHCSNNDAGGLGDTLTEPQIWQQELRNSGSSNFIRHPHLELKGITVIIMKCDKMIIQSDNKCVMKFEMWRDVKSKWLNVKSKWIIKNLWYNRK